MRQFVLLWISCWLAPGNVWVGAGAEIRKLESPDRQIELSIRLPDPGANEVPRWSLKFRGRTLFSDCGLGLRIASEGETMAGARLARESTRSMNERIPVLFGKSEYADDRFRELRLALATTAGRSVEVTFRCYNDAAALRYELAEGPMPETVTIADESTSFKVAGNPMAYLQNLENFRTSHEHRVHPARLRDVKSGGLLDLPLTLIWDDSTVAAITEASLRNYAGMSLSRTASADAETELVCQLTPRPDGTKVVRPLPLRTPWRVALVADRLGALLESQTLYCLNEPSAIGDVSWMKPGKLTFPWWNGDVYDGKPGAPILSFEMAKKYIDFCAQHGIPYHSMTSTEGTVTPWYHQTKPGVEPGPDTDVTRPRPEFDLPAIRAYAQSKQVRLWTWVHHGALRGRVDEAFAVFEKLGWSGMMIDFFDHDDQETVEFTESILKAAARHRILIHFHGIGKPTGLQRTYPNLMNHEGALNLEYLKWSDRCTPEHNLMMAFTRLIAGPMDYHLGGFRAVLPSQFKPRNVAPHVLGTRAHHLAMYVCFDNPSPMVADYPVAYENQAGFEFIKQAPTWWDETRVLAGRIGEVLVMARRKGAVWYLGGMSAKVERELTIPMSFLGKGQHSVELWKDGPRASVDPNDLAIESMTVLASDSLKIRFAPDGGFVARCGVRP